MSKFNDPVSEERMSRRIIVGTAGHIDHGKTALVKALTGTDADRLKEEKERGITIDIGFATLETADIRFGFVDVPGHERFVKNMLAGVHGIDMVMLVVAADEGIMPQTREHFDICRLLGVKSGLIAITKTDTVEDELADVVEEELIDYVRGSFLEGAPIVRVSSKTGEGIVQLTDTLVRLADRVAERDQSAVPRLPIDRVFSIKGFGTVVTGTLIAGRFSVGDELGVIPSSNLKTRVRGLQVHSQAVQSAQAGERTAVNVQGLEVSDLSRGQVLTSTGRLRASSMIDVRLQLLPSVKRPLKSRTRVRLHAGTSEVLARAVHIDPVDLEPGKSALVQLRLEQPILVMPDDRFIIRSYSPAVTIGGGTVIDTQPHKHRKKDLSTALEFLTHLENAGDVNRIALLIEAAGESGITFDDLASRSGLSDQLLTAGIRALDKENRIVGAVEGATIYLSKPAFDRATKRLVDLITRFHQKSPLERGISREELREKMGPKIQPDVFRTLMQSASASGRIVMDRDLVRLAGHEVSLTEDESAIKDEIAGIFQNASFQTKTLDEVAASLSKQHGIDRHRVIRFAQMLISAGDLIRVADFVFHKSSLEKLRIYLADYKQKNGPQIDVASFKDLTGVSRKYAIPLLEYLDRQRVTRRKGDVREIL